MKHSFNCRSNSVGLTSTVYPLLSPWRGPLVQSDSRVFVKFLMFMKMHMSVTKLKLDIFTHMSHPLVPLPQNCLKGSYHHHLM